MRIMIGKQERRDFSPQQRSLLSSKSSSPVPAPCHHMSSIRSDTSISDDLSVVVSIVIIIAISSVALSSSLYCDHVHLIPKPLSFSITII